MDVQKNYFCWPPCTTSRPQWMFGNVALGNQQHKVLFHLNYQSITKVAVILISHPCFREVLMLLRDAKTGLQAWTRSTAHDSIREHFINKICFQFAICF
jgi:hypothetical protein